ncbi:MAG: HipA domain-containing protein [Taibaiella sp.]|nr:HipA domain-containing protein [Taibaiella sp.]
MPPARHLVHVAEVPENEHLTMQIAKQVFKIDTAINGLVFFKDGEPAYITKRFDVKPDGTKYMQEDFAQLTNRTRYSHGEAFKYSGTYEEIGGLIKRYVAAAIPALERFFQLVVFNYVISNGDAHLKNFSLLRNDSGEYTLSPAYDLISTVIHTPHEADTALDLYHGDINSPYYQAYGHYGLADFMELARRLGILDNRADRIINQFAARHKDIMELIEQSFLSMPVKKLYASNVTDKIGRIGIARG